MKTGAVLLKTGLVILLTTGAAYASDQEHHGAGRQEHQERHEGKIYGTVEKLPDGLIGTWVVKGRQVRVTKETVIQEKHGKAEVGAYVEVEGNLVDKTLNAYEIEVKKSRR